VTRTRIKFCGITREDDARAAAALGADAIGLVFAAKSPRRVDVAHATLLAAAVPPFVARVGLFMDADADAVRAVLAAVPLDVLQFHGAETPAFCRAFGRPYIKAVPMGDGAGDALDTGAYFAAHAGAVAFLLDSHASGGQGGSGRVFDWSRVPATAPRPIVLAGGLNPETVGAAVRRVRPYAVDVSSGIESAPGLKDYARMRAFVDAVRVADRECDGGTM
jgi:phosphoribosylanthranilate isomerase